MEFNKRLFKDNPLHIYSYEINKDSFKLVIININKGFVSSLTVNYQEKEYLLEVNSSERVIEVESSIVNNSYVNEIPIISKAIIDENEIEFKYEKNYMYLIQPKSIANMRDEKYLYIQKMVKYNGCKKENVRCAAGDFPHYWHCTCGSVNLNCQEECINCHIEKEKLFSHEIDNSIEEVKTRRIVRSNIYIMWLGLIVLFIQFAIVDISFGGDIFFSNSNLNSTIGVINRVIVPVLLTGLTIGVVLSRRRYLLNLEIGLDIARIICLIYLSIVMNISFVAYSHSFVFFVGFNLILIGLYIAQIIMLVQRSYQVVSIFVLTTLLITGCIKAGHYSKIDMSVSRQGVSLVIKENNKELNIIDSIDNVDVFKIVFKDDIDYSAIETINISDNLNYIVLSTPMNLPSLKTINVSSNNPYLYIKDEILFYKGTHDACLVPSTIEEVTIDWEVVEEADFKNCKNLKRVIITNKVKEIKNYAFSGCSSLEEIVFEDNSNLEYLGEFAFGECLSLKEIEIPKSVQRMERGVLFGCSNIEKVSIPFMGEYRYSVYDSANPNYYGYVFGPGYNFDHLNVPNLKEVYLTDQKIIQNVSFYNCPAEKIVINGESLLEDVYLGNQSLYGCKNLKEFVVPEGIVEIKENCFKNCVSLEKITLPSTLKSIKMNAFKDCVSLKETNFTKENIENIEIQSGNDCLTALFSCFEKMENAYI